MRLKCSLGFQERKVLINSFILSNFNYYPLVWSISSAKSLNKIENLKKRALRFLHNDYSSSYEELFKKSGKSTVNVSNYCSLRIVIFKTLTGINPSFMKQAENDESSSKREIYKLNLEIPKSNQVRFGTRSLRYLGPKVWNSLPYHLKSSVNLTIFKTNNKLEWNSLLM